MYNETKYTRWYYQLIEKRLKTVPDGYTEKHHIIPKSLGGPDDSNNLVELTAREHYICHWLLTKMTTGAHKSKMMYAMIRLCNGKDTRVPARVYEYAKLQYKDFHWSKFKTAEEIKDIYVKRGNQTDNFSAARKWYNSLSDTEKRAHHKNLAKKDARDGGLVM